LRGQLAGGVRAAAARRHRRRRDAVHAARCGRSRLALGDANPSALGRTERSAAPLSGRGLGTAGSRTIDNIDRTPMAGTIADRMWRVSSPEAIEADLAALWRELASTDAQ